MYNIKNPDRLDFIRKISKERGIDEIFSIEDTKRNDVVEIGNNVKIKDGTVIGTDGWGYERNEKLELEKFPHYGKVIIGDNVDISSGCTIDRGNMHDTIIGEGTKIVLTGDIEQIDNVNIDETSNGLTYAIEKLKYYDITGHITFIKGERSQVATLCARSL